MLGVCLDFSGPFVLSDADYIFEESSNNVYSGLRLVTGDINSGGKPDIVISAPDYDGVAGQNVGKVFVFYGESLVTLDIFNDQCRPTV